MWVWESHRIPVHSAAMCCMKERVVGERIVGVVGLDGLDACYALSNMDGSVELAIVGCCMLGDTALVLNVPNSVSQIHHFASIRTLKN